MAARFAYWTHDLTLWMRYAYGLGALAVLLVPRSALWARRWLRDREDQRLFAARTLGATTTSV